MLALGGLSPGCSAQTRGASVRYGARVSNSAMVEPQPSAPWSGHAWTILPTLGGMLRKPVAPPPEPWLTTLRDERHGTITLRGELRAPPDSERLVVLVHGLGGSHDSAYMRHAAGALHRRGLATLSLSMRGADRSGADVYHAGLTADLDAALASAPLRRFAHLHLLGFSLGGHLALRWAMHGGDARVRSVAAVCAPLHLESAQQVLDHPRGALYRHYVLNSLKEHHTACAQVQRQVVDPVAARRVRRFREWDELVVVPRFGLGSAANYYATMSVAQHLGALRVPSLLVLADGDPMIPPAVVAPWLPRAGGAVDVRWTRRGGHLGFPSDLDLGLGPDRGLHGQVASYFTR